MREAALDIVLTPSISLERIFDGGAALQMATVDIRIIAILSPKGGNC
jgi:hypothetical protein